MGDFDYTLPELIPRVAKFSAAFLIAVTFSQCLLAMIPSMADSFAFQTRRPYPLLLLSLCVVPIVRFSSIKIWHLVLRLGGRREEFLQVSLALVSHVMHADGRLDEAEKAVEHDIVFDLLGLVGEQRERALGYCRRGQSQSFSTLVERLSRNYPALLQQFVIELLFVVAAADGVVDLAEEKLLDSATLQMRLSETLRWEFFIEYIKRSPPEAKARRRERAQADHQTSRLMPCGPYSVVGVQVNDSDEVIKAHYRKLVRTHHPDVLVGRGLPVEFIQRATNRFREIQGAYEEIRRLRGKTRS